MPRRSRPTTRSATSTAVQFIDRLEARVLFASTVHNDSFDVTALTTARASFPTITGTGIGVAVLDSGVDVANPDLKSQVVGYYNAVEAPLPTSAPGPSGATDNDGHGTHVSGTAASADPAIGVAYGAHLVDVKVIADGGETQLSGDPLLRGLQFVAEYGSAYNVKVVNMSLGEATSTGGINDQTAPAADDIGREIGVLEGMGITVVAASGNSYANDPVAGEGYPAVVSTIAVASTWSNAGRGYDFNTYAYGTPQDSYAATEASAAPDRFSATSQRSTLGNQLVAPGVDVYSDWNGTSTAAGGSDLLHNTLSGTSMATPFVSGTIALMQQAALTYGGRYITSPNQVLNILRATADKVVDANVSDNGRVPISNGQLVSGGVQNLPETGATYYRVDVLHALRAVQQLFTGAVSNVDTDNTTATATAVPAIDGTAVQTQTGNVGTDGLNAVGANDVDLYAVTLTSTGTLAAALTLPSGGQAFTAEVRVFDAAGNELARVDGSGVGGYPTAIAGSATAPLAAGTYYVGVSSVGNAGYDAVTGSNRTGATGGTGDYQLSLALGNPDPNGVVQGAVAVDLTNPNFTLGSGATANVYNGTLGSDPAPTGSTATRVAVPNGDVDMFAVVAPDTGTLTAQVNAGTYGANGADSFVEVFTRDATTGAVTVVGSNGTASGFASDSRLSFPVTLGTTYFVAVTVDANRSFSPTDPFARAAGSTATATQYDLYLQFDNGNANGTALLATAAAVGTDQAGTIGSTVAGQGANGGFKYVNWYAYTPTATGLLDLTATATGGGFSPNVQLWTLAGTGQSITEVAGVTGSGHSLTAPVVAGTPVYVSVTGAGNANFNWYSLASGSGGQTGTYTLSSAAIATGTAQAKALNDNSVNGGTPEVLTTAAPVSGDIGMDGGLVVGATDVDLYTFTPAATGAYDLRTGTGPEGSADTYLRLFNADGTQVAANDNADSTSTASFVRADLTAGVTYLVGVSGSGNAAYNPITGDGTADATKAGLYTLSVAPATLPAITVASPAAVVPTAAGAALTFVVSLDQTSTADVTVDYATADGTALAGTDYTATAGTLTIPAGQTSGTVTVPVLLDTSANATLTFSLDLTNPGPNALLDGGRATGTITDLPVTQLPFGNGQRAAYTDASGHRVTVSLAGPGTGVVDVIGSTAAEVTIATTGTTAASRLSIAAAGGTTVDQLTVAGSVAAITAPTTTLAGNLAVAGTARSITLAGATGGMLSVAGTGLPVALRLGTVADLSVSSAGPISILSANAWADLSNADVITAPAVGSLVVAGTFAAGLSVGTGTGVALASARVGGAVAAGAWRVNGSAGTVTLGSTTAAWSAVFTGSLNAVNVRGSAAGSVTAAAIRAMRVGGDLTNATVTLTAAGTTDLGSLAVGGTINTTTVNVAGSVGAVRARAMLGSTLLAGTTTPLPVAAADFTTAASIASVTITGLPGNAASFAASDVAAASIGRVAVRNVERDNAGAAFGFASDTLVSFADAEPGQPTFRWTARQPASALTFTGDLIVRVFGG